MLHEKEETLMCPECGDEYMLQVCTANTSMILTKASIKGAVFGSDLIILLLQCPFLTILSSIF